MSTFIEQLKERAKKDIKTIVLAEGEEIRTLKAAEMVKKEGYAKIILVGNPDKIKTMAAAENLDIDGIKIVDSENSEKNEEYANVFYELRKKKGITPEQAAETIKDPSYYAVMMVKQGDADGMVSGAIHSSADTIRPSLQILKTAPGTKLVSAFFIMNVPNCEYGHNGTFIFGDCGLNQDPTADEVSEIAISSAASYKQLIQDEPRVAMLSYSTYGSVQMEGSKMDTFWYCSAVCICSHIWKLCPGSDQRRIVYGSHYFVFCSVYRYLSFLFQEKGSIFISSGNQCLSYPK